MAFGFRGRAASEPAAARAVRSAVTPRARACQHELQRIADPGRAEPRHQERGRARAENILDDRVLHRLERVARPERGAQEHVVPLADPLRELPSDDRSHLRALRKRGALLLPDLLQPRWGQ